MKRPALFLPTVALAFGLAVTGCGGSDEAPAISHDDFVTQANEICADASAELQEAGADLTDTSSEEDLIAFIEDTAIPNFQGQHDDIEDLGAPEGDEDDVDALLTALQDGIDAVSDDPSAFIVEGADPFADANEAATELDLTDCAT